MESVPPSLAPFFRALGHGVHARQACLWIEVGAFSLMAFPSTAAPAVTDAEAEEVLHESGRIAATFVADDRGVPAVAWWVRDPAYGPASLQRQFRQNLRRGEGRTVVRPLTWGEFRASAHAVHRDVAAGRGTTKAPSLSPDGWERLCDAAEAVRGLEATGCFIDGALAAYVVSLVTGDVCEGILADHSPRFAESRPAHALYHGFAAMMIRRDGIRGVTVGRSSIPPNASLDSFKRHAGFQPEPIRVAAVLHPSWRPWIGPTPVRAGLRVARRLGRGWIGALDNVELLDAAAATKRRVVAGCALT